MLQNATVKRIASDSRVEIAVLRQSACGHKCDNCDTCSMFPQPEATVFAENHLNVKIGDHVLVETASGRILGAAAMLYLIPFVLFFAGYLWAGTWSVDESTAIIAGLFGLVLGIVPVLLLNRHWNKRKLNFKIVEIL
jgi:sigma-E factor negative regulatory protein RseC